MKLNIVDTSNKKVGIMTVSDQIFGADACPKLVSQAVHVYLANQRQAPAKVKTRGEVIGGRRKLWAQKGTGRARHGDKFAPQFVGGGVAHGPTGEQNYKKSVNQKMRQKALFSCLSDKVRGNNLIVLDKFPTKLTKTKEAAKIIRKLTDKDNLLILLAGPAKELVRALRNLAFSKTLLFHQINAYEILSANQIIATKMTIESIEKHFIKNK